MKLYVNRENGTVTGIFRKRQYEGQESLDDSHQDIQDYIHAHHTVPAEQEILKTQEISDNLPTWAQVETAIDNISDLADAKIFLNKLARVVYWLAKNKSD